MRGQKSQAFNASAKHPFRFPDQRKPDELRNYLRSQLEAYYAGRILLLGRNTTVPVASLPSRTRPVAEAYCLESRAIWEDLDAIRHHRLSALRFMLEHGDNEDVGSIHFAATVGRNCMQISSVKATRGNQGVATGHTRLFVEDYEKIVGFYKMNMSDEQAAISSLLLPSEDAFHGAMVGGNGHKLHIERGYSVFNIKDDFVGDPGKITSPDIHLAGLREAA